MQWKFFENVRTLQGVAGTVRLGIAALVGSPAEKLGISNVAFGQFNSLARTGRGGTNELTSRLFI
jgi:hypothetical protein